MLIVIKLMLVAIAVVGQFKLFPEKSPAPESSLESVVLPEDRPELVLARRAMEAQGLCHAPVDSRDSLAAGETAGPAWTHAPRDAAAPEADAAHGHDLANNCF